MSNNKHLNRQQKSNSNDEYYTQYITMEYYISKYFKDKLKDKIIYCFTDSEQSNIVKYFKDNQLSIQYKELIYTSDDYHNHKDLFQKADVLFTNPPFHHINHLLEFIKEFDKDFVLWAPAASLSYFRKHFGNKVFFNRITSPYCKYILPDGTLKAVGSYICSSFDVFEEVELKFIELSELIKDNNIIELSGISDHGMNDHRTEAFIEYLQKNNINLEFPKYRIKGKNFLPKNYYQPILVPLTVYPLIYNEVDTLYDSLYIVGQRTDGSETFSSVLVKFKNKE